MSKILVTGGAGFIGSNLVDGLVAAGHSVAVLDDLSTGKREYLNAAAQFIEADVAEPSVVAEILATGQFEYVFHLAAQIGVKESVLDPVFDNRVNALGSLHLFRAAQANGVKKVFFISTGGALYGDVTEPARETMLVQPTSPYAIHKFTAERYLELMRTEYGLNYLVLRLANVYGPRQFKGGEGAAVAVFTYNAMHNQPSTIYGDGSKTRDFVYVGDVVAACLKALDSDYQGVVNIGTGQRISVLDLLKTIERVSGQPLAYSHEAGRPGEVQDSILSVELAKKVLAWQAAVSLEEGIRHTLDWASAQS